MLTTIAWRNVWRSRGRSLVVIGSIVVGIWALIFMLGFMNGFMVSYINGAIKHEISHIQIHKSEFKKDNNIGFVIADGMDLAGTLALDPRIQAVSPRSITSGMISSPRKSGGVKIYGIIPESEGSVTRHDSLITEGSYFKTNLKNPIVIGKELANTLKVKLNSKVVLTFQDRENNLVAGAFRVAGMLETTAPMINKATAYIRMEDLNRIAGLQEGVHEIALFVENPGSETALLTDLRSAHPGLLVESWREIAPELELFLSMTDSFLWVLIGIIMIALIFGIINTMLMAVLERYRELGMLMAIGMNPTAATRAVIKTGRKRAWQPSRIASSGGAPSSSRCLMNVTNTSPLRIATPLSAIKPIAALTVKGMPRSASAATPPTAPRGIPVATMNTSRAVPKLK